MIRFILRWSCFILFFGIIFCFYLWDILSESTFHKIVFAKRLVFFLTSYIIDNRKDQVATCFRHGLSSSKVHFWGYSLCLQLILLVGFINFPLSKNLMIFYSLYFCGGEILFSIIWFIEKKRRSNLFSSTCESLEIWFLTKLIIVESN